MGRGREEKIEDEGAFEGGADDGGFLKVDLLPISSSPPRSRDLGAEGFRVAGEMEDLGGGREEKREEEEEETSGEGREEVKRKGLGGGAEAFFSSSSTLSSSSEEA